MIDYVLCVSGNEMIEGDEVSLNLEGDLRQKEIYFDDQETLEKIFNSLKEQKEVTIKENFGLFMKDRKEKLIIKTLTGFYQNGNERKMLFSFQKDEITLHSKSY